MNHQLSQKEESEREAIRNHIRERWKDDETARKLIESGALSSTVKMLNGRRRVNRYQREPTPLDIWIVQSVQYAMHEPDVAEKMTASQRKKLASSMLKNLAELEQSLSVFRSKRGMEWPFQPLFDRLSLDLACDYRDWLEEAGITMEEDSFHRARYASYRFFMENIEALFSTMREGVEWFLSTETIIKQPNDKNAKRLYFIRTINRSFCAEFRSPCRAAALELASVFFDCRDLDEAALSKLAPFHRPKKIMLSADQLEQIRTAFAENGKPFFIDELIAHAETESNWGSGKKDSAE